jgi:hypothetical protein
VVKGQATNEVLCQTGRALYTSVTNELTTWPLSGQHTLHQVSIGSVHEDGLQQTENNDDVSASSPSNTLLSQAFSDLENLELSTMVMEKDYVKRAQLYSRLHTLVVSDRFILAFVEALDNESSFKSLRMLYLCSPWPSDWSMSYAEFVQYCATKRPYMNIVGDVDFDPLPMGLYNSIIIRG